MQGRYARFEYDIIWDSMLRVRQYAPIENEELQDLIDLGLLTEDLSTPHRLFSVTQRGRNRIGEAYRQHVDFGDGKGALEETSVHVMGIEIGRRLLEERIVVDETSSATEDREFYALEDGHRIDVVAVDDAGEVVVTIEVEHINNETRDIVPADYDKTASCSPDHASSLNHRFRASNHGMTGISSADNSLLHASSVSVLEFPFLKKSVRKPPEVLSTYLYLSMEGLDWTMPVIQCNGADLYYEEQGEGPTIVLLHGGFAGLRYFEPQLVGLSEDFQTIALDFRGHGRSEKTETGHTLPQHAHDLRSFLEQLNLTDVAVVGWSMGALVSWEYVDQFGTERIRAL